MKTFITTLALVLVLSFSSSADDFKLKDIGQYGNTNNTQTIISDITGELNSTAIDGRIAIITFHPASTPSLADIGNLIKSIEEDFDTEMNYSFGEYKGKIGDIIISINADTGYMVISDNSILEQEVRSVEI